MPGPRCLNAFAVSKRSSMKKSENIMENPGLHGHLPNLLKPLQNVFIQRLVLLRVFRIIETIPPEFLFESIEPYLLHQSMIRFYLVFCGTARVSS